MRRQVAIEIINPVDGLETRLTPSMIAPTNTPKVEAGNSYYGMVQKEYGTSLFSTGAALGAPTNLLLEANFGANSVLEAFTHTGMYKYTSGADAFVIDCSGTYSGTFSDQWSACMHNNVLVYSNGVNLVQAKLSYSATGTTMGGVATDSYKAVAVVSLANHLNLYRTTETGTENRNRVRWSIAGPLNYNGADWTGGTAGFLDLIDMEGSIMTAERLGNNAAVIYAERSIHLQEWVGGTDVYRFTKMIVDNGVASRRAVVAVGTVHYVLARDKNVYEYSGGRDMKAIGDAIKPLLTANINDAAVGTAFLEYIPEESELRVHIPTGASTYPDVCYICKIKDNYKWFRAPSYYTSKGIFTRGSALTIGQLVGNIGAQNWKFGDKSVAAGAPVYLLGDQSGRVVKRDKTVYSLSASGASTPQTFIFDTKDLSSANDIDPLIRDRYHLSEYMSNQSRWLGIQVEAKGQGYLTCQYSTDGGISFQTFTESPINLDTNWTMHKLDVDVGSPKFMIRFTNTATNEVAMIRYCKAILVVGGDQR